jgi:hypothetical protein
MIKVRLFLSSFAPLFALLALRFKPAHLWLPLALLAILGAALLAGLMRARHAVVANPRSFVGVRDEGAQIAGYLASYILPLLVISEPAARDLLAYLGFLAVFGVVFVRSDLVQVNPLLYLYGYRLFAAEDANTGTTVYLLVQGRRPRPRAGTVHVSDISGNLVLVQPLESS